MVDRAPATLWPQLYDSAFSVRKAVLDTVYDAVIVEQVLDDGSTTNPTSTSGGTGQLTLSFSMPASDPKIPLILNEMCLLVNYPSSVGGSAQDVFTIRTVTSGTDQSGSPIFTVAAEGRWYELGSDDAIVVSPAVTTTAAALTTILAGTGWTIGTISPSVSGGPTRTFEIQTRSTPLAAIRALPSVFGGEIVFDTVNRTVSLLASRGVSTPKFLYARGQNVSSDQRVIDTSQLTTRLYPLGASGLDITTVNGGVGYIENYSWYDAQLPPWPHVVKAGTSTNDTISDPTQLKNWGTSQLGMLAIPRVTYTVNPVMLRGDGIPGLGDVVRVWDKAISLNANSRVVQRTFNLMEPTKTTLQINTSAFALASALPIGSPRGTPVPVASLDNLAPASPSGLAVTGTDTIDGNGNHIEYLNFTWTPVITNADGSICVDLDHYEVQYRIGTNNWISAGSTASSAMQSGPMPPGQAFSFQVRAADKAFNYSPWTVFTGTTPGVPVNNLNKPSAPTLDVATFPLTIRATWDGLDNTSTPYPTSFDHLEVHVSTVSGFTPSSATLVDTLKAPGTSPITGRIAGTTYYVCFVAVDTAGFKGTPSNQISAVPTTVQDGQIAAMNIGKLLAGSLVADMTVAARIKTADTGARVELSSLGLQAFDATNTQTVFIKASDGSITLAGPILSGGSITGTTITGSSFKTAASGKRIELDSGSSFSDRIQFFTGDAREVSPTIMYIQTTLGAGGSGGDVQTTIIQAGQLNSLGYANLPLIQIDGPSADGTTSNGRLILSAPSVLVNNKSSTNNDLAQMWAYTSSALGVFSGWANYGGGFQNQIARLGYDGKVTLSGLVLRTGASFTPTAGTQYVFQNLPAWATPGATRIFIVPTKLGMGTFVVYVNSSGSLGLVWLGTGTAPSIDINSFWVSLDGITYSI